MPEDHEPAARISLGKIYDEVQALRGDVASLQSDLPHHVSITKDKQDEYETRLENHGRRIYDLEHRVTQLEGNVRPRTPWYAVVGAIAAILTSVVTLTALIALTSKIGAALP